MTDPVVRTLCEEDLPAFRELLEQWDDGDPIAPLAELSVQVAQAREAGGEVFLAETAEGGLAGYAQCGLHVMVGMGAALEVVALLVRADLRGSGIGTRLLSCCGDFARVRGCGLLMLSSQLFRERAHAFYRRQGFREVKRSAFFVKEL